MNVRSTITVKALIGFSLIAAVLSVAIVKMHFAIGDISDSVNKISEPSRKLQIWKSVSATLNTAESCTRKWKVNADEKNLMRFDSCREIVVTDIHVLKILCVNYPNQLALCDSLRDLSEKRFELLGDWIAHGDSISSASSYILDQLLQTMATQESSGSTGITAPPSTNKISGTALADSVANQDRNFWQKIFGKRKKDKTLAAAITDSIQPVTVRTSVKSASQTKSLKKKIAEAKFSEDSALQAGVEREMNFLQADNDLTKRISDNGDRFEKLVLLYIGDKILTATDAAKAGTRSITIWMFSIAAFVMALFLYFIQRDVTREKKLQVQLRLARENAEKLAKAKEEFLANVSHEIRTPLNIISGFSDQMLKSPLTESQRLQAEGIHRSSDHLVALISDILDFSKMQSGKMELERIGFRISDLVSDLKTAFGTSASEKGLSFNILVEDAFPEIIIGDPVRTRQVLFNLASNAVKFTEKGNISIHFSSERKANHEEMKILVADTGIGISQEKLSGIFDEFTQADSSITRRYGGTGLGLSISRHITHQMGGTISVDSRVGKGTSFMVSIPLVKGYEKDLPVISHREKRERFLEGKVVIVCDDEPYNRIVAGHILQSLGATVLEAGSGDETFSLLRNQPADLILMDLQMPEMSGNDVARAIRASSKRTISSAFLIAVTGRSNPGEKERCFENGFDGYLTKPYKEEQLIREIRRVILKPIYN